MASDRTDFLRFSAYSMKDLITRKLSENSKFTDQIYEGSNLAILIDLVSYMYQCLVYQLNLAAAESMFQDTQMFQNIQRLVNLLGYNVRGCYPSVIQAYIDRTKIPAEYQDASLMYFQYTRFNTGITDSNGRPVYFSTRTKEPLDFDNYVNVKFYNGQYKMYSQVLVASGIENETFVLDIGSDSDENKYVANDFIDVYVQSSGESTYTQWTRDSDGIFLNRSSDVDTLAIDNSFYGSTDSSSMVYTVYLNQDKRYELKFGDGIVGRKLAYGDKVIVMYLDTNGPDGEVDISDIDFNSVKLEHGPQMFGMSQDMYGKMFVSDSAAPITDPAILSAISIQTDAVAATSFTPEQTVEQVRQDAPTHFNVGNRLITSKDYEYYIKNSPRVKGYLNDIADVKCMNNTEFVSVFYKWLYQQGLVNALPNGGRHYFDQQFWNRTDYKKIDPADCNNTYVWIKTNNPSSGYTQDEYSVTQYENDLNDLLKPIKTMTTEIQVVKPVLVNFDICANPDQDRIRENYMTDDVNFDSGVESYLEITLDDNTVYISTAIQSAVESIIKDYFNINRCWLGQNVQYGDMLSQIYAITGVKNVRTVCRIDGRVTNAYDGISFASWSPILNDSSMVGVDLIVGNISRQLEEFQFPVFSGGTMLGRRIKVIKKSMTAINTIKN